MLYETFKIESYHFIVQYSHFQNGIISVTHKIED